MKFLVILILNLFSLSVYSQDTTKHEFDGHKWQAPYHLSIPKDWGIERFLIPISFAPSISYNGVEDIRFTPGWGNAKSDEYWTYAFLWFLEGSPEIKDKTIEKNLKAYYTGLIQINSENYKVPAEKIIPVKTSFKKTKPNPGDLKTFKGTIEMLDYMQHTPIILNCIVHIKACPEENKTIVFHELSPQSLTHKNWLSLNQLWIDFKCKKD